MGAIVRERRQRLRQQRERGEALGAIGSRDADLVEPGIDVARLVGEAVPVEIGKRDGRADRRNQAAMCWSDGCAANHLMGSLFSGESGRDSKRNALARRARSSVSAVGSDANDKEAPTSSRAAMRRP